MATKKKPIIGPATKAKITSVVRKAQNSKAAGTVKKAATAVKQEARVIGRAVTSYKTKKEQAKASASPASAFQVNSEVFGKGKIKSPSQIREEKKQERSDRRVANRMSRSADRAKRIGETERSFTTSPGSERYQSSKDGLVMYKDKVAISLPKSRRKAIRVISENLNTKAEGRDRKKLAKEYYADIKSKPKTDAEKRKRDNKLQRGKRAATTGGGNNLCRPQGRNNDGGF